MPPDGERRTGEGDRRDDHDVTISETGTKLDLKTVASIIAVTLALAGMWFATGSKIDVNDLKVNARIDALEAKTDRQVALLCAIARKLNVESGECK